MRRKKSGGVLCPVELAKCLWRNMRQLHPIYYSIYAILFVTGLIFPSNNWDSMTYHLPRVMHWMQNGNLNFYSVMDTRQLVMPPLSEYKILHSMVLAGCDVFASSVQYVATLMLIPAVSGVVNFFVDDNERHQKVLKLTVVLIPSIAMILFQATTTQTDLVASCFAVLLLYWLARPLHGGGTMYGRRGVHVPSGKYGYFAKPTSLVFMFFVAAVCGVIYIKRFSLKALIIAPMFALSMLIVAGPFLYRMKSAFGSFLGDMANSNLNASMTPAIMVSNIIKNLSLHLTCPHKGWNDGIAWLVRGAHRALHLQLDAGAIYGDYCLSYIESEDVIGNLFYLCVLLAVFGIAIASGKRIIQRKALWIYTASLVAGYCLFSLISPWQPWQTRLDLPFFVLTLPIAVYVLSNCNADFSFLAFELRHTIREAVLVLLVYCTAFMHITCNDRKNLALLRNMTANGRNAGYICKYAMQKEILHAVADIDKNGWKRVGLCFGGDSYEYPFWVLTDALHKGIRMEYLGTDYSNKGFASVQDADVWVGDIQPPDTHIYAMGDNYTKVNVYLPNR